MKTLLSIIFPVSIMGFFLMQSMPLDQVIQQSGSVYPEKVKNVIDNKCYGCHSINGKSQDAKDALMWDSLPGLPKSKIISTLDEIIEVLDENKMPPEGAVKKNPDMKMLSEESKLMKSWAEGWADSLIK